MLKIVASLVLLLACSVGYGAEIEGHVTEIAASYGNIDTDIGFQQLETLNVSVGDEFVIIYGDKRFTAHFGTTYGDVPKGEWVGLLNGMGTLRLARNFENAAETLGIKTGDALKIATGEAPTAP